MCRRPFRRSRVRSGSFDRRAGAKRLGIHRPMTEPKTPRLAPGQAPRLAQGREHVVATVDEIPPGTHKLVPIGRHGVGVYNVNGTFYAIANYCPHEGGPLCAGRTRGLNIVDDGVPGDAVMVRDLSLIHISEPTRLIIRSRMPSSA